jgi:hypothetical protein
MPLTFLSHQAVVLPLKIAAPRAVSGTALVLGSMAPDVEYFLRGYPTATVSHSWVGQLTFCLPVTLVLFWLVTRVIAEPAAAHVPDWGDLQLADYALLARQPAGIGHSGVVVLSALIGSASHLLLDGAERAVGGVPYHALSASAAWVVVNVALWIVLAAATLRMMQYIGRRHLLRRWVRDRFGPPPASPARPDLHRGSPGLFWGWVAFSAVVGAGLGMVFRRPGFFLHQGATWVHIWLCSMSGAFVGLVLASAAWHIARTRVPLRGNE